MDAVEIFAKIPRDCRHRVLAYACGLRLPAAPLAPGTPGRVAGVLPVNDWERLVAFPAVKAPFGWASEKQERLQAVTVLRTRSGRREAGLSRCAAEEELNQIDRIAASADGSLVLIGSQAAQPGPRWPGTRSTLYFWRPQHPRPAESVRRLQNQPSILGACIAADARHVVVIYRPRTGSGSWAPPILSCFCAETLKPKFPDVVLDASARGGAIHMTGSRYALGIHSNRGGIAFAYDVETGVLHRYDHVEAEVPWGVSLQNTRCAVLEGPLHTVVPRDGATPLLRTFSCGPRRLEDRNGAAAMVAMMEWPVEAFKERRALCTAPCAVPSPGSAGLDQPYTQRVFGGALDAADGDLAAVCSLLVQHRIHVLSARAGKELYQLRIKGERALRLSFTGPYLAVHGALRTLDLLDKRTGALVGRVEEPGIIGAFSARPSSPLVAYTIGGQGQGEGEIKFWSPDAAPTQEAHPL